MTLSTGTIKLANRPVSELYWFKARMAQTIQQKLDRLTMIESSNLKKRLYVCEVSEMNS